MGVERAVTRWYALRQCLLDEIADLEAQLAQQQEQGQQNLEAPAPVVGTDIFRQLAQARAKLRDLGPCPKVMMG
jgi:NAD dependent epimerase/dehydratase family enzyme